MGKKEDRKKRNRNSQKKIEKPNKDIDFLSVSHPTSKIPRTFGQKAADAITNFAGSWGFIIGFLIFLIIWMILNTSWILFGQDWDPYPFILLNLVLSCVAAIQAPIILMSQNRTSQVDRIRAKYDYAVNRRSEREIQKILSQLNRIEKKIKN